MLLNLTELSNEPLQNQISRQIREKILSGELSFQSRLPAIREVARKQHLSMITVRRAYEVLMNEGLIYSQSDNVFFVSEISKKTEKHSGFSFNYECGIIYGGE